MLCRTFATVAGAVLVLALPLRAEETKPIKVLIITGDHGENVLGHDVAAMKDLGFQTLMIRGVEWAATGTIRTPVPDELKKAPGGK